MRSPITATTFGRKDKYDPIDDSSKTAAEELLQWRAKTVDELRIRFDYDTLTEDAKVSYYIRYHALLSFRSSAG